MPFFARLGHKATNVMHDGLLKFQQKNPQFYVLALNYLQNTTTYFCLRLLTFFIMYSLPFL